MDWHGALTAFVGDGAAGLVILGLGYWYVDNRLNLRERASRRKEIDAEKTANRTHVLKAVLGELRSNAAQWETVTPVLAKAEGVPFPLFDIGYWDVLAQAVIFTTLKEETVATLTHAYNRMGSANDQCKALADLSHGSTGLLAHAMLAGRMDDPQVAQIHDQYIEFRDDTRLKLLDRLADLKPHLDAAIDAVEAELGLKEIPAAHRRFEGLDSPADGFPLGEPRKIVKLDEPES